MICGMVVFGKIFGHWIYKKKKPKTWSEVVWRTAADRFVQYIQAWSGILVWKGVWDIWSFYILVNSPWVSAVVAHFVGIGILLLLFAFRSAVMPPMIFAEDTIMLDSTVSRWNILSKFWFGQTKKNRPKEIAKQWEWSRVKISKF